MECDIPGISSGEQLITPNEWYSNLPDLHPLAEVGYSPGKDELVCHVQLTTSMHQLQTVHNSPDAPVQTLNEHAGC